MKPVCDELCCLESKRVKHRMLSLLILKKIQNLSTHHV